MRRLIGLWLVSVVVLVSACGGEAGAQANGESETTVAASNMSDADAEVLRGLAFGYWEAFNAYEPERVLAFLEGGYAAERGDDIRGDIDRLSRFGVTLGISEETPPTSIGEGEAEMFLSMREPLGTRRIRMGFTQVGDEWVISFAEEVD